jgi:hypothetical protein
LKQIEEKFLLKTETIYKLQSIEFDRRKSCCFLLWHRLIRDNTFNQAKNFLEAKANALKAHILISRQNKVLGPTTP